MRGSRLIGTLLLTFLATTARDGSTLAASGTNPDPSLAGVAPGRVLAGQQVVVYGRGLRGARCVLGGPVAPPTALPVAPPGPEAFARTAAVVPLTLNPDATAGWFEVPPETTAGAYAVRLLAAGGYREPAAWLVVEPPLKTIPPSAEARPFVSLPLVSGQAVRRTLDNRGERGWLTDVHFFHFVAGKGAQVEAEVSRVDRSRSPLHPDSIELELYIVHPEGWVPLPLQGRDVGRNSEKVLQIKDAFLPKGGLWRLAVGTTHGRGEYELRFTIVGLAPLAEDERFIPVAGNLFTARAGTKVRLAALHCDPRGVPISGAPGELVPSGGLRTTVTGARAQAFTDPDGVLAVDVRVAGEDMAGLDLRLTHRYPDSGSLPSIAARTPTPERPIRGLAAWITTYVSDYLGQGVLRLAAPNLQRERRF